MSSVPCSDDVERTRAGVSGRATLAARWFVARLSSLLARMPLRFGHAIANGLAWPHYLLFGERRRAVLANLAVLRSELPPRERGRAARRVMASYNKMLFEFFRLPRLSRDELLDCVEVVGLEGLEKSLELHRGVILTSSHIGNWELGAVVIAMHGHRVHAVAGVQLGRWLTGAIRDAKNELAVVTIAPEDSYRKLFRALRANDIVGLMVDGDIFSHGTPLEFFGRAASWPAGPGVLAKRTRAPVVCGYCERTTNGTFRVVLEPPLDPDAFATANDLNVEIARTTERHIAPHVEQWCIFRRFWDLTAADTQRRADDSRGMAA
jgi:KDO2-lipid IV(A) lauroyltransferase